MKQLLIFFFIIFTLSLHAQTVVTPEYEFKAGSTALVHGHEVKMRSTPSTTAKIKQVLSIGEKVTVVEVLDKTHSYNGLKSRWCKIKKGTTEGYTLQALLSLDILKADNVTFLFNIKKADDRHHVIVRIPTLGATKPYAEYIFPLMGCQFKLKIDGNRGLKAVQNIISIDYVSEACGIEGGMTYLTWNGKKLRHLADLSSVADGGIYSLHQMFKFPADPRGKADTIIFYEELTTMEDEATEWEKTSIQSRNLYWDGKQLSPNLKSFD